MIAYAISDPSTLHFDQRLSKDLERFSKTSDWLLYRDKTNVSYREYARILTEALYAFSNLKLLIHDDVDLALELGVYGVHFSSHGIGSLKRAVGRDLFTVASTHSLEEALFLEAEGVSAVTLSPIFSSPGKGNPLGISYLAQAVKHLKIPLIALGGVVTEKEIALVQEIGTAGFASIRYFGTEE